MNNGHKILADSEQQRSSKNNEVETDSSMGFSVCSKAYSCTSGELISSFHTKSGFGDYDRTVYSCVDGDNSFAADYVWVLNEDRK